LIALAKNAEGVLQSGSQVLGNDIRRKEYVAALIQHITAIIAHGSAPARRSQRWLDGSEIVTAGLERIEDVSGDDYSPNVRAYR
jgi:hypothetical protein